MAQDGGRDAVKLRQVKRIDLQPAERGFRGGAHAFARVLVRVEIGCATELGGDEETGAALAEEATDQRFAAAHAVNIGRIEKRDTGIGGSVKDGERIGIIHGAPIRATQLPAAETDLRDGAACVIEQSSFHRTSKGKFPRLRGGAGTQLGGLWLDFTALAKPATPDKRATPSSTRRARRNRGAKRRARKS